MKNLTRIIAAVFLVFFSLENVTAQCAATGVNIDPQPITICEGDVLVVNFTPSGVCGANYEYEVTIGASVVQAWSTTASFNASPITTTVYTVKLRCSACPAIVVSEDFTVGVLEEPNVTGNLSLCSGDSTTLTATGPANGTLGWWDSSFGGAQLSGNGTLNTGALTTTTTFWSEVVDTSAISGGVQGSILITECGLEGMIGGGSSDDYIELSNLYSNAVNTTGWVCAVSSSYNDIDLFNSTLWNLPSSFAGCTVVTRTDNNGGTVPWWGSNIFWNPNNNGWAIIIDNLGNVIDFACWGWTSADLLTFNPTINGFPITLGTEWLGNGCSAACSTTGGVQYSLARNGNSDNNNSGDFICQATSVNVVNPLLQCGWTNGLTCRYPTTVTVTPNADATITPVIPVCMYDPAFNLTAVDTGGVWSGVGISNPTAGTFDPLIAGVGTHTIIYTISGACGDADTIDIEVFGGLDATINPAGPLCETGSTVFLTAIDSGGVWSGTGIINASTGEFDPGVTAGGTHTITYSLPGNCGDIATFDIIVYTQLDATITPAGPFCDSDAPVILTAVDPGGVWSGTGITNASTGLFDPIAAGVGTHTITYDIAGLCGDLQTEDIIVYPIPTIDFVADYLPGCAPLDVVFTNLSTPAGTDCYWDFGNGESSVSCGTATAQYTNSGCFDVTLSITQDGCSNSQEISNIVCVVEDPIASYLVLSTDVDILDPEFEFANNSIDADTYLWDFGDGTTSSEENPTHVYDDNGGYNVCLIATNTTVQACADTICTPVVVKDIVVYYIPNTFTPDGDEINQSFRPIFSSGYDPYDYEMLIYNRWGEVIWESHDDSIGWDGTFGVNGRAVSDGVYTWRLEFKTSMSDERVLLSGSVNLIR